MNTVIRCLHALIRNCLTTNNISLIYSINQRFYQNTRNPLEFAHTKNIFIESFSNKGVSNVSEIDLFHSDNHPIQSKVSGSNHGIFPF